METQTIEARLQDLDASIEQYRELADLNPDAQVRLNGGALTRVRNVLASFVAQRDALLAQIAEDERRAVEEAERAAQARREQERVTREQLPAAIERREEARARSRAARTALMECEFFRLLLSAVETEKAAVEAAYQVHMLERAAGIQSDAISRDTPITHVHAALATKHDSHPCDRLVYFLTNGPTVMFNRNRSTMSVHVPTQAAPTETELVRQLRGESAPN